MPFQKVYDYETVEEMKEIRKYVDKTSKFKKYWLKNYNICKLMVTRSNLSRHKKINKKCINLSQQ